MDLTTIKGTIGIIDNDLIKRPRHNFPNLALMKISNYLKLKGNIVELTNFESIGSLFSYDYIIISKVFTDTETPIGILDKRNVIYEGTGFYYDKAQPLPLEIEHFMPDYNLYTKAKHLINIKKYQYFTDHSIGFMTRGCIRQCEFCVNKHYTKVEKHSDLNEFYDPNKKYITLLDDNITAYKYFEEVLLELKETKKPFVFKQGMDFRLLTEKKIQLLSDIQNYGKTGNISQSTYYFAFDNIKDKDIILKKLSIWNSVMKRSTATWFYVLTGFDFENKYDYNFYYNDYLTTIERIKILYENRARPYLMLHENVKKSPFYEKIRILKIFCNMPLNNTNKTFEDFINNKNINIKFTNNEQLFTYRY